MALGNPPTSYDLALDLTALQDLQEHRPGDLTATVQAGITLEALQGKLTRNGQFLPLDPPLPERATIGGLLATGSCGPLRASFGLPRDLLLGMTVALADGALTHSGGTVVKNVTGYAMEKLHSGALGTLGVILEATFKLAPIPREERTLVAAFDEPKEACAASREILRAGLAPLALEVLNSRAWETVLASSKLQLSSSDREHDSAGGSGLYWLVARFGGRAAAVARQEREALASCKNQGAGEVEVLKKGEADPLWQTVCNLGWEEPYPPLALRVAVSTSQGPQALTEVEALRDSRGQRPAVALHATHGVLRAFWGDVPEGLSSPAEAVATTLIELRGKIAALNGSLVLERAPSEIKRRVNVWGPVGEDLAVMRRLKEQYDPKGILNPGRFVGGI